MACTCADYASPGAAGSLPAHAGYTYTGLIWAECRRQRFLIVEHKKVAEEYSATFYVGACSYVFNAPIIPKTDASIKTHFQQYVLFIIVLF
jgi:hypothetical protein